LSFVFILGLQVLEGLVEPDTYHITLALFMSENLLVPFLPIVMDNDKDFIEILTCSMKLLMNKDIFLLYSTSGVSFWSHLQWS
jgi:hypothetical protein